MNSRAESAASAILAICAVAIAATAVHREFAGPRTPVAIVAPRVPPTYDSTWRELVPIGIRIGAASAPVVIVEFADFECTFCARFHQAVDAVRSESSSQIAVVFIHFPLPQHRFARPASRAAECADQQQRFAQMSSLLFQKQDSLGLKSWTEYAAAAGVADTARFSKCLKAIGEPIRIEEGVRTGHKMQLKGTPTVLINGWRYTEPPSTELLSRIVAAVTQGKSPASISP